MNKTELMNAVRNGSLRPENMNAEQRTMFAGMLKEADQWESSKTQAAAPVNFQVSERVVQEPLRSPAEVSKAMQDERYRTDPAYRSDVAERIDAGLKAGHRLF